MTRVFICYSRLDLHKVRLIVEGLEKEGGIEVWFADREIRPGQDITNAIHEAIKASSVFLFCASGATENPFRHSFLAKEQKEAIARMRSDHSFKAFSIRVGRGSSVPLHFGQRALADFSHSQNWSAKLSKLAEAIRGDTQ